MGADGGPPSPCPDAAGRRGGREARDEAIVVACGSASGQLVVGVALLFFSSATQVCSFVAPLWWWGRRVQGTLVTPRW
jgi:hypothetical protein